MCSLLRVGGGGKEQRKPCIHFFTFARAFIITSTIIVENNAFDCSVCELIPFFCVSHSVLGRNVINVWGEKILNVVVGQ